MSFPHIAPHCEKSPFPHRFAPKQNSLNFLRLIFHQMSLFKLRTCAKFLKISQNKSQNTHYIVHLEIAAILQIASYVVDPPTFKASPYIFAQKHPFEVHIFAPIPLYSLPSTFRCAESALFHSLRVEKFQNFQSPPDPLDFDSKCACPSAPLLISLLSTRLAFAVHETCVLFTYTLRAASEFQHFAD